MNFVSEQQRYLRIQCVSYGSPGNDDTVGYWGSVSLTIFHWKSPIISENSKLHIPQHPILASKTSFHHVQSIVHAEEFVFCKCIFTVWGVRWQSHLGIRSVRDAIEYRWRVTLWSWDLEYYSHIPLVDYIMTVQRKGGDLEVNLEEYIVYITPLFFLLSRLLLLSIIFFFLSLC